MRVTRSIFLSAIDIRRELYCRFFKQGEINMHEELGSERPSEVSNKLVKQSENEVSQTSRFTGLDTAFL